MKQLRMLLLVILVLALSGFAANAQDNNNDPTTNPDANACYEGGSMAGRCNNDSNGDGVVSEDEVAWAWTCGWYLIRYEHGMIPAALFPADCAILLSYIPDALCLQGILWYSGVPNTRGNFLIFTGGDCFEGDGFSGGGLVTDFIVIVNGDTVAEARANCEAVFGTDLTAGVLIYPYPGPETNLWLCLNLS